MLQAAVMQLAPSARLEPCCSASCCWRWAAQQLLEEYATVRSSADGLRAVLDEEIGRSAQQRLLKLQREHDELLRRWRATSAELAWLKKRHQGLEGEHLQALAERGQASEGLQAAERAREQLQAEAAARESEFAAQLAAASRRPGARELEEMLEEERAHTKELEGGREKASEELTKVRIQRTDLEWKVQQLRMALGKEKKRRAPRRKPRDVLGTSPTTVSLGIRLKNGGARPKR